jgi:hypothetical protein
LGLLVGIVNSPVCLALRLIDAVIDLAVDATFRVVAEVERAAQDVEGMERRRT